MVENSIFRPKMAYFKWGHVGLKFLAGGISDVGAESSKNGKFWSSWKWTKFKSSEYKNDHSSKNDKIGHFRIFPVETPTS